MSLDREAMYNDVEGLESDNFWLEDNNKSYRRPP